MNNNSIKLVDLFAGVGGFHQGLKTAAKTKNHKIKVLLASEIEDSCKSVYKKNFGTECQSAIQGDINKVDLEVGKTADLVTAGFPCQPFSNSGKKLGLSDHRGQFYFKIEEIIKRYNAKAFILENVPGIRKNGGGFYQSRLAHTPQIIGKSMHFLEENLIKLKDYQITWKELDSSDFACPQVRKRIFIVGIHKDLYKNFNFDFKKRPITPFIEIAEERVISTLELNKTQENNIRSFMNSYPSYKDGMRRVGQAYLCPGGNVGQCYHANGLVPTLTKVWARYLPIYFAHKKEELPKVNEKSFTPNNFYGKGYIRRTSVREAYRLQGFPDNFNFHENQKKAYEHAGNAVNVSVVKELARKVFLDILN